MATLVPPRSAKRQRLANAAADKAAAAMADAGQLGPAAETLVVQLRSAGADGVPLGPAISLPAATGQRELEMLVNQLRRQARAERRPRSGDADEDDDDADEDLPFAFHVALPEAPGAAATSAANMRLQISKSIADDVLNAAAAKRLGLSSEDTLSIVFEPQAVFRVRPVTRCTSTLSGHASPILCSSSSPTGTLLATGAGDKTARIWDVESEMPLHTLAGHRGWVLCAEWEGRERRLATGDMEGDVWVWDALDSSEGKTGRRAWGVKSAKTIDEARAAATATQDAADGAEATPAKTKMTVAEKRAARHAAPQGKVLKGHTKWITSLSWEPIHSNAAAPRLASSSKDGTVKVWNVSTRLCEFTLGGHSASVNVVRWGGEGAIYTASSDRTVKVWDAASGKLIRTLNEHAHWVNTLALSTDFVLRTGPFDHHGKLAKPAPGAPDAATDADGAAKASALARYRAATAGQRFEQAISGSDDHTLFLWAPQISGDVSLGAAGGATPKKSLARLTGHQKTVNHVCFSPDGRLVASAGFDNAVKLWDARTGRFIATLRGHVANVYRVDWSADSRLLVSASKDSTVKLWDLRTFKLRVDLPGHSDEVYCISFAADKVVSGGRDKTLKIWRN